MSEKISLDSSEGINEKYRICLTEKNDISPE